MPWLRRIDCSEPWIRQIRRGRGFSYQEEDGTTIEDRETIERIRELAIPPRRTTFGLATLRRSHLRIESGVARFDYTAKGVKRHRQEIADPAVVPTLKALRDRDGGGQELLA
jgi:DNA topoisomerase IB